MPTYDYACDSCNHTFEAFQKMSDSPLDTCPECGKKIRRVLSGGIGVSFKGSGFYVNDSSSKCPASGCASSSCPQSQAANG